MNSVSPTAAALSGPIRVLLVDGDPEASDRIATHLDRADDRFDVVGARRVDEGLDRLAGEQFDCVVASYDVSETTGLALLDSVRDDDPELPFVLYAADGSERIASEAISAGVSDYVSTADLTDDSVGLADRIVDFVARYRSGTEPTVDRRRRDETYRRRLVDLATDPEASLAEQKRRLLELGREVLDLDGGNLVRIDPDGETYEVTAVSGSDVVSERVGDLSDTYCRTTVESDEILTVYDAAQSEWADHPAYEQHGLACYVGTKILLDGDLYGTICFVDEEPRDAPLTADEIAFVDLLAWWFEQLLERDRRHTQAETIFQHTQDALFLIDVAPDETFEARRVNRAYEELTGFSTADLRGKTPSEVFGEENGAEIERRYRDCVSREEPIEYEETLPVDGETRHWRTTLAPVVEDGEVIQLVGATRDVSEQRRRERELERQNDLFQKAQDIADVGAWEYYVGDDEALWTEQVYDIYELPHDHDTDPEVDIEFYHPDDRVRIRTVFERAIEKNVPYDVELRLITGDGEQRWVRTRGDPQTEDGEVVRVRGTIQDITERKKREEELVRQNERLDEFATVVSHDLRNPLNVAGAWLDLARSECDSEHLDDVAAAHDRMTELIDDLLTFARSGMPVADEDAVDLSALPELCWVNVETTDATLVVDAERTIRADRERLKRLFENLLRNSVEHGSTDSRPAADDSVDHGSTADPDDAVTITVGDLTDRNGFYVADDGPGISADERESVFESSYSTSDTGTGFGLSIVTEIVEAHGWTIQITDSEDGGARFEIAGVDVV